MYIRKITINNFSIYYGINSITLGDTPGKNVFIISGDNGAGKTSLLTSLVWCLYGKQMQEVEQFYKARIYAAGGYKKYLASCMNRLAFSRGEKEFYVSIYFENVALPGITCAEMQVKRTYSLLDEHDVVRINVDGRNSELIDDFGQQLFIQDFMMPKEIAKFFFFDADKIIEIAETQSRQDKKLLSQAYSEVLGIKKYEDLRNNLKDLRIRFRKDSANELEKAQFKDLAKEINRLEKAIRQKEMENDGLLAKRAKLKSKSDEYNERLIREGNAISIFDIENMKSEKERVYERGKALASELRDMLELAPFAMVGKLLMAVEEQLNYEHKQAMRLTNKKILSKKIKKVVEELKHYPVNTPTGFDSTINDYYVSKVFALLNKHLIKDDELGNKDIKILHNFTNEQKNLFDAMLSNLRIDYRERLLTLIKSIRSNRVDYRDISKKLARAEAKEMDALVNKLRYEKSEIDKSIQIIDEEMLELSKNIGSLESSIASRHKLYEELAEKIKVNERYVSKDWLVRQLINELSTFITYIKSEKKDSLAERILSSLNALMHKTGFIHGINVDTNGDILDIQLIDGRGVEITKDTLSRGEQQIYATALLKALVEESGIDFPVIIDSPLQKFDDKHSRNIITGFYPHISKQVVLLPLINTELTKQEYKLLAKHINSIYKINNYNGEASEFTEVDSLELFAREKGQVDENQNVPIS